MSEQLDLFALDAKTEQQLAQLDMLCERLEKVAVPTAFVESFAQARCLMFRMLQEQPILENHPTIALVQSYGAQNLVFTGQPQLKALAADYARRAQGHLDDHGNVFKFRESEPILA